MDFAKWLFMEIIGDSITWIVVAGILISWLFGVRDIIKYGWDGEKS